MEAELRHHLKACGAEYARVRNVAMPTVGRLAANDWQFFVRLDGGNFTIRKYDAVMGWFATHWPDGAGWPDGVPRPYVAPSPLLISVVEAAGQVGVDVDAAPTPMVTAILDAAAKSAEADVAATPALTAMLVAAAHPTSQPLFVLPPVVAAELQSPAESSPAGDPAAEADPQPAAPDASAALPSETE